jgi:hypothetical protein
MRLALVTGLIVAGMGSVGAGSSSDEDLMAQIEFRAAAYQALLKQAAQPTADLPAELLQPLQNLIDKTSVDSDLWLRLNDSRMHSALALRALLLQSANAELADQVANNYLATNGFNSTVSDLLNSSFYAPAWSNRSAYTRVSVCHYSAAIRDVASGQKLPAADSTSDASFYSWFWHDGARLYTVAATIPPAKGVTRAVILSQSVIRKQFSDDVLHLRVDENKTVFTADGATATVEPQSTDSSHNEVFHTEGNETEALDLQGRFEYRTSYLYYAGELATMTTHADGSSGDLLRVESAYKILSTQVTCQQSPAQSADSVANSFLKNEISQLNSKFALVEQLRRTWLICLAANPEEACATAEKAYRAEGAARDELWSSNAQAKPGLSFQMNVKSAKQLIGTASEVQAPAAPAQEAPPSAPTPAPVAQQPPAALPTNILRVDEAPLFEIPGRECTYMRSDKRRLAYCDGNLICIFDEGSPASASCSDGQHCKMNSGHLLCKR